jgi:hypothetical protein
VAILAECFSARGRIFKDIFDLSPTATLLNVSAIESVTYSKPVSLYPLA